jgi:hypothetical protein
MGTFFGILVKEAEGRSQATNNFSAPTGMPVRASRSLERVLNTYHASDLFNRY